MDEHCPRIASRILLSSVVAASSISAKPTPGAYCLCALKAASFAHLGMAEFNTPKFIRIVHVDVVSSRCRSLGVFCCAILEAQNPSSFPALADT
jgi:hypothetical protein